MKFGAFASIVICGSLVAACTVTTIHGGDGGDDGSFTSAGNGNGNVTVGGANLCDSAAATILSKDQTCGLASPTTASSTSSTVTVASSTGGFSSGGFTTASSTSSGTPCSAQQGAIAQAEANCFAAASCAAITGTDTLGAQQFATCLNNANTTTSTSITTGSVSPDTSVTSGGGSCFSPESAADCASCTTQGSCVSTDGTTDECCETAVPGGIQEFNSVLVNACACTSGSACYSVCSDANDLCQGGAGSQACVTCLNGLTGQEACVATFQSECQSDSTCEAYLACVSSCPQ